MRAIPIKIDLGIKMRDAGECGSGSCKVSLNGNDGDIFIGDSVIRVRGDAAAVTVPECGWGQWRLFNFAAAMRPDGKWGIVWDYENRNAPRLKKFMVNMRDRDGRITVGDAICVISNGEPNYELKGDVDRFDVFMENGIWIASFHDSRPETKIGVSTVDGEAEAVFGSTLDIRERPDQTLLDGKMELAYNIEPEFSIRGKKAARLDNGDFRFIMGEGLFLIRHDEGKIWDYEFSPNSEHAGHSFQRSIPLFVDYGSLGNAVFNLAVRNDKPPRIF